MTHHPRFKTVLLFLVPFGYSAYVLWALLKGWDLPDWWLLSLGVAGLWTITHLVLATALGSVYRAAVYHYAVHGTAPPWGPFTAECLITAYKPSD